MHTWSAPTVRCLKSSRQHGVTLKVWMSPSQWQSCIRRVSTSVTAWKSGSEFFPVWSATACSITPFPSVLNSGRPHGQQHPSDPKYHHQLSAYCCTFSNADWICGATAYTVVTHQTEQIQLALKCADEECWKQSGALQHSQSVVGLTHQSHHIL